jgi:hypothetical protein
MPRFAFDEWLPENLRLTVFPTAESLSKPEEWWKAVTGGEPDQVSISKQKGTSSLDGPYGGGKLFLRSAVDRIDWLLAPTESTIEHLVLLGTPNSIGPMEETFAAFSAAAQKWFGLADSPGVNRMALGAILGHPVEDQKQAYLDLMDYIPVRVSPDSSDLVFQINPPPVGSKIVQGLTFNRLSKWMAAQLTVVASPNVPPGVALMGVPLQQTTSVQLTVRLELDVNTVPTFQGPIPREQLGSVFGELVDEARGIILNGVNSA